MSCALKAVIFLLLVIISISVTVINNNNSVTKFVFAQPNQTDSVSQTIQYQQIETKKVRVGDIEIGYKIFGKGDPILLITGLVATLDMWNPVIISDMSLNHTVIIFDNRGMGSTTSGNEIASIDQFAKDAAGLLDALDIRKPVNVLGWSMGGFVAQELALQNPEKVNKIILYASSCGTRESTSPSLEVLKVFGEILRNPPDKLETLASQLSSVLFPKKWLEENPNYLEKIPLPNEPVSVTAIQSQVDAIENWGGSCDRLNKIRTPTLLIVGTDDNVTPPNNSLMMAEKIPGAWLVQLNGSHGLMYQYPEEFSAILLTFLAS